jgi:hypothetical protein
MAAAIEVGLFHEAGIEPEFIVFQGADAFLSQIAQKKILIGLPLIEPALASYDTGNAKLPVTFFYNANPYNGLELAVLASRGSRRRARLEPPGCSCSGGSFCRACFRRRSSASASGSASAGSR